MQHIEKVTHIAQQLAEEYQHESYGAPHLLKASLNKSLPLLRFLFDADVDVHFIDEWADVHIENYPKRSRQNSSIKSDDSAENILDELDTIKVKLNKEDPDLLCLFIAAITPGVGFSYDQLKSLPANSEQLIGMFRDNNKPQGGGATAKQSFNTSSSNENLNKFTKNMLSEAANGTYDVLIGREKEQKRIAEVLNRKSKPHLILVGEPGVGKTALVNVFAKSIYDKNIVFNLQDANIFEVNTAKLLSGASYKGDVEDRIQNIFQEARAYEKPIIFIDDFHTLLEDKNTSKGIVNSLKSELNSGDITLIAASTPEQYRKLITTDQSLDRRIENITIEEPNKDLTLKILEANAEVYTEHHKLNVSTETLSESIRLAKRYLKEKSLPDSAIDLIDKSMSAITVSQQSLPNDLETLNNIFKDLKIDAPDTSEEEKAKSMDNFYTEITTIIDPIILEKYITRNPLESSTFKDKKEIIIDILQGVKEHSQKDITAITDSDLTAVVSALTGIPAGKVQSQERERLIEMEETLKKRVIGQQTAIKTVADAVIESRSGLSKPGQPIGSFFFLGPTGTGKTELAKSLAEFLFNDENSIIRFDMSEFKEEHSAALLYGAPPGYVGYEEGGVLVNKIRQKPYSIVLFDEIEKAHQSVFDVFLQILDEGKLNDRLGKEGDFSNAVILFTSNIGSDYIAKSFEKEVVPTSNELIDIMVDYFRPEFLGRITEIVPFAPISEKIAVTIFNLHLKKELLNMAKKLGLTLEIDDETRKFLALNGFSPTYGVRPLKGVIRNRLRRPLSKMIISGALKAPQTVKITLDKEEVIFTPISSKEASQEEIVQE